MVFYFTISRMTVHTDIAASLYSSTSTSFRIWLAREPTLRQHGKRVCLGIVLQCTPHPLIWQDELISPPPCSRGFSASIIIGLVFVVVASLLAYFFAPKGENQTYVIASFRAFFNHQILVRKNYPAFARLAQRRKSERTIR